ncbi:SH3 domain-containing protein [Neolewinella xylanilytica]|uniref:SH3 domain-containing protein n=1 Tax=Neolewinella xylanilytica TaxID=1514080 RepID=A0A2S6I4W7_9BACT|nr:SH3 domain-containing protein [Neolewinella xylanilytica]PPK86208.1 SH3 domain-containing protein [Neolewinella xylanilytica]
MNSKCVSVILIGSLTFLVACGAEDSRATDSPEPAVATAVDTLPAVAEAPPLSKGEALTAWVDGLFIRIRPERGATVVTQVAAGTPLTFTGGVSEDTEVLMMRGIVFEEPWLQVRTTEGAEGWVYGGAVQRTNDDRGMAYLSAERFEFPHFGTFDLRDWEKLPVKETSGGSATRTRREYRKDDRTLAIQRTEVGDYGLETNYILTDADGNDLKIRTLEFAVDPRYRLTETVTDYTVSPPVRYRRVQDMPRHYTQLDAVPELATGAWETTTLAQ